MAKDPNRFRAETAIFVAHDDYQRRDIAEAEKNLMRAVLRTAMDDLQKKGEVYRDARRFFLSREEYYLYSFMSICYHLDLCPKTIYTIIGLVAEADNANRSSEANVGAVEPAPDSESVEQRPAL